MKSECCKDFFAKVGEVLSFSRILALGYCDGPTSGLAECRYCGGCYRFEVPARDENEHDTLESRIFVFWRMPEQSFIKAIKILEPLGPPTWPVWVPRWDFASDRQQILTEQILDKVINYIAEPAYVVMSKDICEPLIQVKEIDKLSRQELDSIMKSNLVHKFERWISFLQGSHRDD